MGWFRHHEDPPWAAAMADFAGQVDRLQEGDLLYLSSAWLSLAGPAQNAAWHEVSEAIDGSDRRSDGEALESGLVRWSGSAGRTTMAFVARVPAPGSFIETDLRRQALPALWDAGRAILSAGLIGKEAYDTLIEAWRSLFEDSETQVAPGTGDEAAADREKR